MNDEARIVFISGANRGIGYGLALEMSRRDYRVCAGFRDENRSQQLLADAQNSDNLFPVKVDITIQGELEGARELISTNFGRLDVLVNNAGVNIRPSAGMDELEWLDLEKSLEVNVGGPFLTTKTLYPLLVKGRNSKIINMTSQMSSIKLSSGATTPYRISKAGLNMLTKNQSVEYFPDGVTVICLNPGWVKTEMGGRSAPLTVEDSVRKILNIIDKVSLSDTGKFISVNGAVIPY